MLRIPENYFRSRNCRRRLRRLEQTAGQHEKAIRSRRRREPGLQVGGINCIPEAPAIVAMARTAILRSATWMMPRGSLRKVRYQPSDSGATQGVFN